MFNEFQLAIQNNKYILQCKYYSLRDCCNVDKKWC